MKQWRIYEAPSSTHPEKKKKKVTQYFITGFLKFTRYKQFRYFSAVYRCVSKYKMKQISFIIRFLKILTPQEII